MPTNTTIPNPQCLHIPTLRRGGSANLLWEENVGYELDWAVAREGDEGVTTWQSIEDDHATWQSLEDDDTTWQSLQGQAEPQWQPLYCGPGQVSDVMDPECTFAHILHGVEIPADALSAQFRVRSYCGDQFSPYITSEIFPFDIPTGPEINGNVELNLIVGKEYHVQVNMRDLPDFADSVMTLRYPADKLTLLNAFLDSPVEKTDLGEHTYCNCIEEVSREPGTFRFRCTRPIPENTDLTGLVACFRFTATADGDAAVILQ